MVRGNSLQAHWRGRSVYLKPPTIPGNVFYVDNTNGSNSNSGRDWQRAFSTLNYAISKCTDALGDLILVAPYHTETIDDAGTASGTTTDELVLDKTHVTIRGLGSGMCRPTFTLGSADTTAAMVVTAGTTHCVIDNLRFVSGIEDLGDAITLTATSDHTTIMNCDFQDGGAALEMLTAISIAANCDDVKIINCNFRTTTGGGCTNAIELVGGCDRIQIIGCTATGDWSTAPLDADAAASTEMIVVGNVFANIDDLGAGFHGGCTGIVSDNAIAGGSGTVATGFTDSSACWNFENYVTDAVNASGIVYPAADGD
jgi:hypothetical protein